MKTWWLVGIIISILFLFVPCIWECWNDRNGDLNKRIDLFYRGCLALCAGILCHFFINVPFYKGAELSLAIHFLLFDYMIAYILIKRQVVEVAGTGWFEYLGYKGVVDNIRSWRGLAPAQRAAIRIVVFTASLLWFLWQWF